MKTMKWMCALMLLLAGSGMALAQDAKPAEHRTIAQVLDHAVSGVENEFVSAAYLRPAGETCRRRKLHGGRGHS